MNSRFNTNQSSQSPGYKQREFDSYKMNGIAILQKYIEVECRSHGMNPQVNANQQTATEGHDDIPLPERKRLQHNRIDKMDLQEHSLQSRRNLYSIGRYYYIKPKNKEYLEERGVYFAPTFQNELVDQNESFASNSSLKNLIKRKHHF
ncbi:hypothetical protein TNCT_438701 [Trichonephila clavata]|uniref:Uncharacterized protein n=1 Tax=Trichonephila clavata TaxID=2740835 RepID=A0A8X6KBW7_TRICU|nr:hypothetical protein TNCT_438701 [Trichonephila clavata]